VRLYFNISWYICRTSMSTRKYESEHLGACTISERKVTQDPTHFGAKSRKRTKPFGSAVDWHSVCLCYDYISAESMRRLWHAQEMHSVGA
jgi:hypothetical protein